MLHKAFIERTSNAINAGGTPRAVDMKGSYEVPPGYGGCLRPRWVCLPSSYHEKVSYIVGLTALRLAVFWDMDKTKCCNGFYIEFRQIFAKETFSYDEHLTS